MPASLVSSISLSSPIWPSKVLSISDNSKPFPIGYLVDLLTSFDLCWLYPETASASKASSASNLLDYQPVFALYPSVFSEDQI